ncbi:glutathione S-transferase [Natronospira proteinivora]|uniref:Glutathione S-transferase n=1 Tax=Natronospira proteinivora TaxID=1807133 RepID=A0ABT1G5K6_9GAMM|nr:glutathione S-transferase N-terminal domain-containing protein [Natronospira proteinivora]MCP1726584.1 glutathione S-transferase [Natronospira proteinivora]
MSNGLIIFGRRSSHYTRMTRIFAEELGLAYGFTPIFDLMSHNSETFGGNPALKLPILKMGDEFIYGSVNICRALSRVVEGRLRIIWPEDVDTPLLMNAHEVLAHAMAAQVEVVVHEIVEKRPEDTASKKRRQSLMNCLAWLDANLDGIFAGLLERDLSLFEVGLFCLVTHLPFRNPLVLPVMPRLQAFEADFGQRPSAQATTYRFDKPETTEGLGG